MKLPDLTNAWKLNYWLLFNTPGFERTSVFLLDSKLVCNLCGFTSGEVVPVKEQLREKPAQPKKKYDAKLISIKEKNRNYKQEVLKSGNL